MGMIRNGQYAIDEEGNPKVSRAQINAEIEEIETKINDVTDEHEINRLRSRWNYLMTL